MKSLAAIVMVATSFVSIALSVASATPPPALPTDVYGRLPNIELVKISPSGTHIAYITVKGDQRTLVIKDLSGALLLSAPVRDTKVRNLDWAGDDRLLLTATSTKKTNLYRGEFDQTLVANLANSKSFVVFGTGVAVFQATYGYYGAVHEGGRWYGYFGAFTLQKTLGFEPSFSGNESIDLYRVDLDDGAAMIANSRLLIPHEWAVDGAGKIVAHSEYAPVSAQWTLRPGPVSGTVITKFVDPLAETNLMGLGRSSDTVVVDKPEPEEWSVSTGAHAPLKADRLIEGYLFDPTDRRLVGVAFAGDRADDQFFDERLAARQKVLRKALGATARIVSWSDDQGNRVKVS